MISKIKSFAVIILFFTSITLMLQPASAASIKWQPYGSGAFTLAKASGKKIFVFGMFDSCPWCHKMQSTTFTNATVVNLINSKYVPVKLHADIDTNTADKYGVVVVPTILILNSNGGVISKTEGYQTADEMISALE